MKNKCIDELPGDVLQKSLRQETDFFKGMQNHKYGNVWSFSFAVVIFFFIALVALLGFCILVFGAAAAAEQKNISFIPGAIFSSIVVLLMGFVSFKIFSRLFLTFKAKVVKFKIAAACLLVVPAGVFVVAAASIIRIISQMDFRF